MGVFGGSYTTDPRTLLNEELREFDLLAQIGINWSDDDDNLRAYLRIAFVRRLQQLLGEGAEGDGFKPVGTGASNNLTIKGGGGTDDTALSFWLAGHRVNLLADTVFDNSGANTREKSIHSKSTGLTALVLTDNTANFKVNELAGRLLRPDITDATTFTIASNTATTITVSSGDMTTVAAIGDNYLVELSTPSGSDRTDYIWLNIYLNERPSKNPLIEGSPTECKRILALEAVIHIREGDADVMADYTDGDSNFHYLIKLGEIARFNGQAAINANDVTDSRTVLKPLTTFDLAAAYTGSSDAFATLPQYANDKFVADNDTLLAAIDKLDAALALENIVAVGHSRYANFVDLFADSTLPTSSIILVNNKSDAGVGTVHSANKSGTVMILFNSLVSLNQNGGNLSKVLGIEGGVLRSLLVDTTITLENILVADKDNQIAYGIRLTGSNDVFLIFKNISTEIGSDVDESSFTGTEVIEWERCTFEGDINLTKLSVEERHYFKHCIFRGALTLQAASDISVEMRDCRIVSTGNFEDEVIDTNGGSPSVGPFTGTLSNLPALPGSLYLTMAKDGGGVLTAVDDGAGNLIGADVSAGTINYTSGAVSITWNSNAAASVDLEGDYEDRSFPLPTLTNVQLTLTNCWVGDVYYSFAKIDNTGIIEAVVRVPAVTTTQRDNLLFTGNGDTLLNTTKGNLQSKNNNSEWLDCVSRDRYEFTQTDVAISQTDVALVYRYTINEVLLPFDFIIVGLTAQVSESRTAGTLTVSPSKNGTPAVDTSLDVVIDGTNPDQNSATSVPGSVAEFEGSAGDTAGVVVTTDGSWAPTTSDLLCFLHIVTRKD